MALDIYVGPLSRYYSGRWKTAMVQWAEASREAGETHVLGPPGEEVRAKVHDIRIELSTEPGPAAVVTYVSEQGEVIEATEVKTHRRLILPASKASEVVAAWIAGMGNFMKDKLRNPWVWVDDVDGPYFTDKPGWEPFQALQLWAAYDEHPGSPLPMALPDQLTSDPVYRESTALYFESLYTHLLGIEMWLPSRESFVFTTLDPAKARTRVGFVENLVSELQLLNDRTWKCELEVVKSWGEEAPDSEAPLEEMAKFAFSMILGLALTAEKHKLPMLLDC